MAEPMPGEEELEREIRRATRAGQRAVAREPRAKAASFDPVTGRLVVELVNGAAFMVPVRLLQGLADAPADDLGEVQVVLGGEALHWEALDVDFAVSGLLRGVFGTRAWMDRLGGPAGVAAARGDGRRRDCRAAGRTRPLLFPRVAKLPDPRGTGT